MTKLSTCVPPTAAQELAAFELGLCLNQLGWHRTQALVTRDRSQIESVARILAKLRVLAIGLPIKCRDILDQALERYQETWDKWSTDPDHFVESDDSSWYLIWKEVAEEYADLTLGNAIALCEREVTDFSSELRKLLEFELQDLMRIRTIMRLGILLDEGRHPPKLRGGDFFPRPNPPPHLPALLDGPPVSMVGRVRAPQPPPATPLPQTIRPGELEPESHWFTRLHLSWEQIFPKLEALVLDSRDCERIADWTEAQCNRVREYLASQLRLADEGAWKVEVNKERFTFRGKSHKLDNQPLIFLETIIKANEPPSSTDLIDKLWPDDNSANTAASAARRYKDELSKLANVASRLKQKLSACLGTGKKRFIRQVRTWLHEWHRFSA
jgi:hypothetical protein